MSDKTSPPEKFDFVLESMSRLLLIDAKMDVIMQAQSEILAAQRDADKDEMLKTMREAAHKRYLESMHSLAEKAEEYEKHKKKPGN